MRKRSDLQTVFMYTVIVGWHTYNSKRVTTDEKKTSDGAKEVRIFLLGITSVFDLSNNWIIFS